MKLYDSIYTTTQESIVRIHYKKKNGHVGKKDEFEKKVKRKPECEIREADLKLLF